MYVTKAWADKVVSVQAKSQAKTKNGKSAGNYTEITFSDGVVLQVLHQNATGTQEVMRGHTFNSTINQQTTQQGLTITLITVIVHLMKVKRIQYFV